jgi:hypothetical protein
METVVTDRGSALASANVDLARADSEEIAIGGTEVTPQQHHYNGNSGVSWRWVVGVLLAGFCAMGGWAWSTTAQRVLDLEREAGINRERIVKVETTDSTRKEQMDRIESKIDSLLTLRGR